MKRFWSNAELVAADGQWQVALDGRPVRTPGRNLLALPTQSMAEAVVQEWAAVEEVIDPRTMPMTGLANAAIDRVAPNPEAFAATLARYGESDLLCYRADTPHELAERQAVAWDPILQWGRRRYDVDFAVTEGVGFVAQAAATTDRLRHAVAVLDAFRLAGLSPLVTIGGSLIAALAVEDGEVGPEAAWEAVSLDDRWQMEKWGSDAEAEAALAARKAEFLAGARFLSLL